MKPKIQQKLKHWMKRKISFRFHMSIIMFSTVFLGVVSNFIMMNTLGVTHPGVRYPLTAILSYGWFLLFIRIYIKNILVSSSPSTHPLDFVDIPIDLANGSGTSTSSIPWSGGGGQFCGGGASGDWGIGEAVSEVAKETVKETASSSVSALVDDEGGAIIVLVVGAALAAVVFGSGAYFIWHSPEILSECLIQVILVSGMRKRMKKFSESEWISHIFSATVWPFVAVLVLSLLLGSYVRGTCPDANNLRDYRVNCWGKSNY